MEIDIISFTDAQFAKLTPEQIKEVQEVQLKKNRLLRSLEEKKAKEKYRQQKGGIYCGSSYQKVCDGLQEVYEEEVANLREGLLFYLRFSMRDEGADSEPLYEVDYSLSYPQRIAVVREYYENTYVDPRARLDAFREDKIALTYLGEYYAPLYQLYYDEVYGETIT